MGTRSRIFRTMKRNPDGNRRSAFFPCKAAETAVPDNCSQPTFFPFSRFATAGGGSALVRFSVDAVRQDR